MITGALTERVLFEGKRAVGVAFSAKNGKRVVRARREVILCGGAIGSPQILLLSGVGPGAQLGEHGIPVVHDLKGVGQSLQDHYSSAIKLKCRFPITVNDVMLSNFRKIKTGLEYFLFRRGVLTVITTEVALFARTRPELATPDVNFSLASFSADRPQDGLHPWSGFTLLVYQLRPESRGEIKLKSANLSQAPAMHPNYLATETDRRTIVDGLKIGRNTGGTIFHPTSTCKMGADPMAVVDPQLRVHGIAGLHVADASVMPAVVSGNTNAATIMIGEKLANMLRLELRQAA